MEAYKGSYAHTNDPNDESDLHGHERHNLQFNFYEGQQLVNHKGEEMREICGLCKSMSCCPEHCCNWDMCPCSDCDNCRANKHKIHNENKFEYPDFPKVLMKSSGDEQVKKLNTKVNKTQKPPEELSELPQEQVRAIDGTLISNFEVAVEEEEQYAAGLRGIRALKKANRKESEIPEERKNQYHEYELRSPSNSPKKRGGEQEERKF